MNNIKDWFMSQKWEICFETTDNSFKDTAKVTLKDISLRNKFSYNISFSMIDSIGKSEGRGVLIHQADHFSIAFAKEYLD